MEKYLGRYQQQIYALIRIIVGLMFLSHGCQKLFGFPGNKPTVPLNSLMGIGGIIEFFGGLLVAIGLLAGWAAFITSGEMAVAYFMMHFPKHPLPIINQGEPAVLYCFLFLYIAARGAGIWSIDAMHKRQINHEQLGGRPFDTMPKSRYSS